jgi:hypothetical protein
MYSSSTYCYACTLLVSDLISLVFSVLVKPNILHLRSLTFPSSKDRVIKRTKVVKFAKQKLTKYACVAVLIATIVDCGNFYRLPVNKSLLL